jgi:membrane associated rhomboid family serine protease
MPNAPATPSDAPAAPRRAAALPLLTAAVWLVTATVSAIALLDHPVMRALQRNPSALRHGEIWRVLSPLLVQSDGWAQYADNLAFTAVIGFFAERAFGRGRWLALYLAGGLVGQLLGYVWEPPGGGNSVAVCGLAGGLLAAAALKRAVPSEGVFFAVLWCTVVAGDGIYGLIGSSVGAVVCAVFVVHAMRRWGLWIAPVIAVAEALTLTVLADHHGPSMLAGMLVFWMIGRKIVAAQGNQLRHGVHPGPAELTGDVRPRTSST